MEMPGAQLPPQPKPVPVVVVQLRPEAMQQLFVLEVPEVVAYQVTSMAHPECTQAVEVVVTATVLEHLVDLALVEMVEELLRQPTELLILDQVAAVGTLPMEPSVVLELSFFATHLLKIEHLI
jgi:hypothetical protein